MFKIRYPSRRIPLLVLSLALLGLVLAPGLNLRSARLRVPGQTVQASAKSYEDFIRAAYEGAYGREPDCLSELQPEYDNLVYAANNNMLLSEAQRFVSELFITASSYNGGAYEQTVEYEARNPANNNDFYGRQAFVTDLYHAYLQREPDADGLAYWTQGVANNGRRNTIQAFVVCTEFAELVSQLYAGTRPYCPTDGGGGPCPGSGGGYGQLCP
jgi:hypothetical protein